MMNFYLLIFVVLTSWRLPTATSMSEISGNERDDLIARIESSDGSSSLKNESREGKFFGNIGSYGSYGSGGSSEVFDITVVKQLDCPFAYTEVDGLCLAYFPCAAPKFTYDEARTLCQNLDTGGGDLVTFKDANEYQTIVMYILQNAPTCDFWLGASKTVSTDLKFVDGTSLPNTGPFWYTGEPVTTSATNLYVLFKNTYFYRLATSPLAGPAGAICQYRPGNVTLTQRIYPRRPPQVIPIPYPVEKGGMRGGGGVGGGGPGGGGGGNGTSTVTNLDITLPASNFSSEQNANFQNAPVINIETHSHFIDSSPDIIPIPSYPLPPNGTSYGSPPYNYPSNGTYYGMPHNPQPSYPYNNYMPVYNPYYNPTNPSAGSYNSMPLRTNNPVTVNRPQSNLGYGYLIGNQIPSKLVSRDDNLKAAASNRTSAQKITKGTAIASKPKKHPEIFHSVHVERLTHKDKSSVDGFKQRSKDIVSPLNIMVPPVSNNRPPQSMEKENDDKKQSEDVATQLTQLLDMIDNKYGNPNTVTTNNSQAPSTGTISKAEEAAYMIKIMNELQSMIAKIEHMENASRINTDQSSPNIPPNRQTQKKPFTGSRRMQGSRLLNI